MYVLDDITYNSLEEASKATGIAKQTLEKHVNGEWTSKKGAHHTLKFIEDVAVEEVTESDVSVPDSDCATFIVATAEQIVPTPDASDLFYMPSLHRKRGVGVGHYAKLGNPLYRNK